MIDPPEAEFFPMTEMEYAEFDDSVPGWLLFGLFALTLALGFLLYFSYN